MESSRRRGAYARALLCARVSRRSINLVNPPVLTTSVLPSVPKQAPRSSKAQNKSVKTEVINENRQSGKTVKHTSQMGDKRVAMETARKAGRDPRRCEGEASPGLQRHLPPGRTRHTLMTCSVTSPGGAAFTDSQFNCRFHWRLSRVLLF